MKGGARRFVILDRDGTLIVERNYLSRPEDVELIEGAAEGLRLFEESGWGRIVVTNQSGVNRGYFSREAVDAVDERMRALLAASGAKIDAIYVCPHRPDEGCDCRKPQTALLLGAAAEWDFDPARCLFVGDKACDVELGRNLGGVTMLVRTGYGEEALRAASVSPDYVVRDLKEAAEVAKLLQAR
ncbi:MAG TPA: HAD family hydrolase [Bryobacteraceae bacterium]|nr:HAD family hydrolase [Bryobacteraceae bacterium]